MPFNRRRLIQSGAALGALACVGANAKALASATLPTSTVPVVISAVQHGAWTGLAAELTDGALDLAAAGQAAGVTVPTTIEALADRRALSVVRDLLASIQRSGQQARYRLDASRVQRLPLPKRTDRFVQAGLAVSFSHSARVAVFV